MGNERIPTTIYDGVASTSSTIVPMNEVSRKRKAPSSPIPDDYSYSPLVGADDEDDEEREDEEEEKEDGDDEIGDEVEGNDEEEEEEENGIPLASWPKSDDCELFKRIRKACPKDDVMKYESRVNHLNWESIKFQDYSAEECKNRWLHVQTRLRNYRILAEVLEDAVSWVDGPCYNLNKRGKNNQTYMLPYMEQKDAVLERQPGLEVRNEMAPKTLKSSTLVASHHLLFKAEKMTEPIKPPASAVAYYFTQNPKFGELHPAVQNFLWGIVSEKEKKKCIEEHQKRHEDYVREFEKFIRALNPAELRSYRTIMKNRARDHEDEDEESKSTSASLKSSEGSSDLPSKESAANVDSKSAKSPSKIKPSLNAKCHSHHMNTTQITAGVLLNFTAKAQIKDTNQWVKIRGILDNGSSNSFITSALADKLRAEVTGRQNINVSTFGSLEPIQDQMDIVRIKIAGHTETITDKYIVRHFVQKITPYVETEMTSILLAEGKILADERHEVPYYGKNIDILIGNSIMSEILALEAPRKHKKLLAQNTIFGWVISGSLDDPSTTASATNTLGMRRMKLRKFLTKNLNRPVQMKQVALSPSMTSKFPRKKTKRAKNVPP